MTTSFGSLPRSVSLSSVYSQAGRILAEQIIHDPATDYTRPEAYNTAIWLIAEKACDRGFPVLQGMSTRQVASGIGNHLSAYLQAQEPHSVAPVILGFMVGALGVVAVATAHFWLPVLAMKAAALAHAHPQLTAQVLINAIQAVIDGETPEKVAKAVATNVGGAVIEQPLANWLAGLNIHP